MCKSNQMENHTRFSNEHRCFSPQNNVTSIIQLHPTLDGKVCGLSSCDCLIAVPSCHPQRQILALLAVEK